jgi:hypothetical protein
MASLKEGAEPDRAVSGLLEAATAGVVVKGALGSAREYTMTGGPPVLVVSPFDEVID